MSDQRLYRHSLVDYCTLQLSTHQKNNRGPIIFRSFNLQLLFLRFNQDSHPFRFRPSHCSVKSAKWKAFLFKFIGSANLGYLKNKKGAIGSQRWQCLVTSPGLQLVTLLERGEARLKIVNLRILRHSGPPQA